ncbi:MAG: hypothetical protein V4574_21515 [Pseudomonadota bacterium]
MLILFGAGAAAPQRHAALIALNSIEHGQWQLREEGGPTSKLCVTNPAALLQLRHPGAQCTQVVVENSREVATIHYTCPGHGYGRTTVSVETARLVRIETQGIVDGAPFASELEGRKVGVCN